MNEHATAAHGCASFMSPVNTQMWHAQTAHFVGRNERQSDMVPEPDAQAPHQNVSTVDHSLSLSKGM
jgi:hypothetical protein